MKKLVVAVGGALFNNGKMLVVKRNSDKKIQPGNWEIPGGKIEVGEQPADALKREFKEETGLTVEVDKMFDAWSSNETDRFYIEIDYFVKCENINKVVLSPNEHNEWKWLEKGEKINASPEMQTVIDKAFELVKQ